MMKVSVIMPAYNTEKYIRTAIESILNQTFSEFEFIIIDDGSTDNTWNIVQEFSKIDPRIKAIKNEKNLGISPSRNKGVNMAQGEYIAWQDADDISLPTRLEKQLQFMEEHAKTGVVGGFLRFFDEKGENGFRKYRADDKGLRDRIFRYSPIAQPAAMIRKNCLKSVGGYNEGYPLAEDIDLFFRLGEKYEFSNLQEIILKYREHPDSATFTKLRKLEFYTLKIRRKYSKSESYKMTVFDKIYNVLHFFSIFIIPPRVKIWLFDKLRNST